MRESNFFIQGNSLNDVWYRGLDLISNHGVNIKDNRNNFKEILNLMTKIENPKKEFPKEILKRKNMLKVYGKQFLSSKNNNFSYTYGQRLMGGSIDQIQSIIDRINNNKNTRRGIATTWIPTIDAVKDEVPCMILVDFKLRKRLQLTAVFRSHDFYGAYPFNIYRLSKLQDYVAKRISAKSGGITVLSVSAHIYENDFNNVNLILKKEI